MTGNSDQPNYIEMFQQWMQKGGKSQAEFVKALCSYMENNQKFDPLQAVKELTAKTAQTQKNIAQSMAEMQKNAMEQFFNLSGMMQSFVGYAAFKTTIGSNGRISIPEAERQALKIGEGDLVQVFVFPLEKKKK